MEVSKEHTSLGYVGGVTFLDYCTSSDNVYSNMTLTFFPLSV